MCECGGEDEWIMLPPKIKTPLLASITQTRGDFQLSVPTLICRPLALLCSDLPLLPISPLTLPPPHSLPSPSPPHNLSFFSPSLSFPLHPSPPSSPLPLISLPCPFSLFLLPPLPPLPPSLSHLSNLPPPSLLLPPSLPPSGLQP